MAVEAFWNINLDWPSIKTECKIDNTVELGLRRYPYFWFLYEGVSSYFDRVSSYIDRVSSYLDGVSSYVDRVSSYIGGVSS